MAMYVENEAMASAKKQIEDIATSFGTKASAFIGSLNTTLSTFSGETKDVLVNTKIGASGSETEGTLAFFLEKQCVEFLQGLAGLLEGNRDTIEKSDLQLAEAISGNGGN